MLRKGVYPYEYMDDWKKLNETSFPRSEDFYSHLNMEDITDADYRHRKRVCKDFEIKILGKYHDLYVQNDALLLADALRTLEICVLNYTNLILLNFFLIQEVSMASSFKKY